MAISRGSHLPLATILCGPPLRFKDIISGNQILGFHPEHNMVTLKVSMHCDGCTKWVEKHALKMDGVMSYKVDLENKRVVMVGDEIPVEIVESVSKMKFAELWDDSMTTSFESMNMNSRLDPPSNS